MFLENPYDRFYQDFLNNINHMILGNEEFISIPELNIKFIKARIDSGANSSVMHAFNIKVHNEGDRKIISFHVNPISDSRVVTLFCKAELAGWKYIKSSNGSMEKRPFIVATVKIGEITCENIEITLTNRDQMGHRMLIGRDSLPPGALVDPNQTFILTANLADDYNNAQIAHCKKPLKIGLLASNKKLYSNKRIIEAGEKLGHEMMFLNIKHCYIDVQHRSSTIHCRNFDNGDIASINAIIPRIRPNLTFYGCALVRQFQTMGKYCLNGAEAIAHSRDKLKSLQILASKFIPMPVTTFAASTQETKHLIELVGGAPLVIKLLEGTQGQGVVLVESNSAAESVISAFKSTNTNILVQEFISESRGEDIRCFVVDYKVVGSMLRQASTPGEFRANFHLGGTVESVKVTPTERKIAVSAAKILGLPVAGVDIIRTRKGPMILEVNSAPGLQGIEEATGKDIAVEMIKCIERHCYGYQGQA